MVISSTVGRTSHTVVEGDALVPHRVPDPVSGGGDVASAPVDEDDVEITERAELAAAVSAHGDEGHASPAPVGGPVEELGQPFVGRRRVGPAKGVPVQVVLLDERLPSRPQRHGRTVASARSAPATGAEAGAPNDVGEPRCQSRAQVVDRSRAVSISVEAWPRKSSARLSVFDGVLMVGGGLVALVVAFSLIGFVASLVWTVFKVVLLVAAIAFVVRYLFRRH